MYRVSILPWRSISCRSWSTSTLWSWCFITCKPINRYEELLRHLHTFPSSFTEASRQNYVISGRRTKLWGEKRFHADNRLFMGTAAHRPKIRITCLMIRALVFRASASWYMNSWPTRPTRRSSRRPAYFLGGYSTSTGYLSEGSLLTAHFRSGRCGIVQDCSVWWEKFWGRVWMRWRLSE